MPLRRTIALLATALLPALPAGAAALLVPAYFYPSFDPAQSQWDEMTAAAASGAAVTAIVNPANGPGAAFNSDYAVAIDRFRAAGGRVLGYVYTCYGNDNCFTGLPPTRSVADVMSDAARYASWYTVDGIFLDEMSNRLSELPFYQSVAAGLRAARPDWQIVGNPGTSTPVEYLSVADTLVTYENGSASYAGAAFEPWMATAAPGRQAHMLYNVDTEAAMRDLWAQAVSRNAGYVYITDDRYVPGDPAAPNPWDRLPGYWDAQARLAVGVPPSPVPAPGSAALAALGLGLVAGARRSRRTR